MTILHRFTQQRHLHKILLLCFSIVLALLICQTIANVKDTNDTWILAGITPVFFILTITYVAIVSFSDNLQLTSVLTAVYLSTLNLIPQLKYVFLYGFFDSLLHYQFIQEIVRLGYVPQTGAPYSVSYGPSPGSHILVSELSIVTGVDALVAFKAFLVISPFIIPLTFYLVLKRLKAPIQLSKIVLICTVITCPAMYKFTGRFAVFSLFDLFIYLSILIACFGSSSRSSIPIIALLGVRIIVSHDVTSFFLIACMLSVMIVNYIKKPVNSSLRSNRSFTSLAMILVVLGFAQFTFASNPDFVTIIKSIADSITSLFAGKSPGVAEYYSGFYTLTTMGQISVLIVRIGRDAISLFLSILAPLAIFRLKIKDNNLRRFYYFLAIPTFLALMTLLLTQLIRPRLVDRGLVYLAAFSPFLVGITIYWFIQSKHLRFKNAVLGIVALTLVLMSLAQYYPCQPLIPKISTNLGSYYVMDTRAANSIYKRSMIYFINTYDTKLTMATDPMTIDLIYCLSEPPIYALITSEDPLQKSITAQLSLVSFDENSSPIVSGREAIEYIQNVQNATKNNSVIYTNGKSCILLNRK